MNNNYTIKIGAPLLRPGMTIETSVSKKYVKDATDELMGIVRSINKLKEEKPVIEDLKATHIREDAQFWEIIVNKKTYNVYYNKSPNTVKGVIEDKFECTIPVLDILYHTNINNIKYMGAKLIKKHFSFKTLYIYDKVCSSEPILVDYFLKDNTKKETYSCNIPMYGINYVVHSVNAITTHGIKLIREYNRNLEWPKYNTDPLIKTSSIAIDRNTLVKYYIQPNEEKETYICYIPGYEINYHAYNINAVLEKAKKLIKAYNDYFHK